MKTIERLLPARSRTAFSPAHYPRGTLPETWGPVSHEVSVGLEDNHLEGWTASSSFRLPTYEVSVPTVDVGEATWPQCLLSVFWKSF